MKNIYQHFLILVLMGLPLVTRAQLTPRDAVAQMQKGINLGNTLEPPLEAGWNNPRAQEYYFDLYKEAGFTCIRIPVRWDNHTQSTTPYKIDESWLQRVEEIADWGLDRDLYIIINAHHDDWIKQNYTNAGYRARFDSIWSQISTRFKDKSEKLIFEILNEPHGLTKIQNDDMHKRVLSIIRKTNPTRIVIFQGHEWGGSDQLITAAIPDDDYVIGSFHSYDPYAFGLLGEGTWGSSADMNALDNKFLAVKNWSDQHNIPVILGEFGSLRICDYNSRMKHYAAYVELSQKYGFASCAWDDGGDFRIMERESRKWDEVKDILIYTTALSPRNLNLRILRDTLIQLNWTNRVDDQDSLVIYRRTASSNYARIKSLKGDTAGFCDFNPVSAQYNYYRIIAFRHSGEILYSCPARIYMPVYIPKERTTYLGKSANIPGIIEAENFDIGGEGITYHDVDAVNISGDYRPGEGVDIYSRLGDGYHIGNAIPGEWIEYTVSVEKQGTYKVDYYLASVENGGTFKTKIGMVESGLVTVHSSNSWLVTNTVSDTLNLTSGEQIMRFTVMGQPLFNIDKFDFSLVGNPSQTVTDRDQPVLIYKDQNGDIVVDLRDGTGIKMIRLYNITGSPVYILPEPGIRATVSTRGLSHGIYIIKVMTQDSDFSAKIILP